MVFASKLYSFGQPNRREPLDITKTKPQMKNVIKPFIFSLLYIPFWVSAQGISEYNSGLKVKLNEDGSYYFRLITWHQFWLHYNENNTGSTKYGDPQSSSVDFNLRRSRFLMYAQLNKRFLILTHFGLNNQNAYSGGYLGTDGKRPQLYMHDAWTEYKVLDNYLNIGFGLHYWNGISRMSSASTLNFLALDAPIFNWATIEATDQFARKIGVYAKGYLGKLEYRVAVSDPFLTNTAGSIALNRANYSPKNDQKVIEGYFSYNLLDKESNVLPFYVGSYLGTKKVFNIGAGFLHNGDAMWSQNSEGDTLFHDMTLLGFDAFLDMPIGDKGAGLTAYAVYYNYNFGPNKLRNIGILNPATGSTGNASLRGNAIPLIGTGDIVYAQAGYLLPGDKQKMRYQPFVAFSSALFDGLRDQNDEIVATNVFDLGMNFLLKGHHAKLTLNYRNRPDMTNLSDVKRRSEVVLQSVIYL